MKTKFLFFLLIASSVRSRLPGAKVAFSSGLTNRITESLIPLINNELNSAKIPDYGTKVSGIHVNVFDIHPHFSIPVTSVTFQFTEPNLIVANFSDISGYVSMKVKVRKWFVHETDDCKVHVNGLHGQIVFSLSRSPVPDSEDFVPVAKMESIDAHYDLSVEIHGHLIAKILRMFRGKITDLMRKEIDKLVHVTIPPKINNELVKLIAKFTPTTKILDNIIANLSVEEDPHVIQNTYFSFASFLNFYVNPAEQQNAIAPLTMPDYDSNSNELQIFLGKDCTNTFIDGYFKTQDVHFWIQKNDIYKLPIDLDTTYIDAIFEGIVKDFGSLEVRIKVVFPNSPVVDYKDGLVDVSILTNLEFVVVKADGSHVTVAVVKLKLFFEATGVLEKGKGKAEIKKARFQDIEASTKYAIHLNILQKFLNFLLEALIPIYNSVFLNEIVFDEFELGKVVLRHFTFKVGTDYVHVGVSPDVSFD